MCLIPLVLLAASDQRADMAVFGRDCDTSDGTCIRDYIHINDLCQAHWLAPQSLIQGAGSQRYKLGNGAGLYEQEVIDAARRATSKPIATRDAPHWSINACPCRGRLWWWPATSPARWSS